MRVSLAIAIITLVLSACRLPASATRAELVDTYVWEAPGGWFGGFSAIEMSDNGAALFALTDRGFLTKATVARNAGTITDITVEQKWRLKSSTGEKLTSGITDAEGLVIAPDGTLFISFEGAPRVVEYPSPEAAAKVISRSANFPGMKGNKTLEALARDDKGRLYTLPEEGLDSNGNIPVFRYAEGRWSVPFSIPPSSGFSPVGADFGPDGRFYLLERGFSPIGFRTQLRRWDMGPDGPINEATLIRTAFGTHDNLEGISVWRDQDGLLRATMVADDNFLRLQRTEIVEYILPE